MSSNSDDTISLDTCYQTTVQIGGRTFQQWAIERGTSFGPIDEEEKDRLDRQHKVFALIFEHKLIFPPIRDPAKILDCGYGSGAWAVEVAEKYSRCEVIGVDITPHMTPEDTPPNLFLQVDDLNEPFTFRPNAFDLVHSRNVATGINRDRWPSYVRDCARVLKPGGWLQMIELYHNIQSDNGTLTDQHALRQVSTKYLTANEGSKDLRAPLRLESLMRDAGLTELASRMIPVPMNGWSIDPREREIGEKFSPCAKEALAGHMIIPFTEKLGMSVEDVNALVGRANIEVDDIGLKPYLGLYISIGRKPQR